VAPEDLFDVVTLIVAGTVVELLRRVVATIEAHDLDVLAVIDFSGDAADFGSPISETKLVLFTSPAATAALMLTHPAIGLDLPLRILIREHDEGSASLSYYDACSLARRHRLTENEADPLRVVETIAYATRSTS